MDKLYIYYDLEFYADYRIEGTELIKDRLLLIDIDDSGTKNYRYAYRYLNA